MSYKLYEIIQPINYNLIHPIDMLVGQAGYIRFENHKQDGHLVIRTYQELVSLVDPSKTWIIDACILKIELLPPGSKITLEV